MKILVFDIGPEATGKEIGWLVDEIFPEMGITDYEIHAFEPCRKSYDDLSDKFASYPKVFCYHRAINDREGVCRLYHAVGPAGHSIYATKNNVMDPDDYETVGCTRLSKWIKTNIKDFKDCIKILRFNIEGAEWVLIKDLSDAGMLHDFDIIAGNGGSDITTCSELDGKYEEFNKIMAGIDQLYFCWTTPETNTESKKNMKRRLEVINARQDSI